MKYLIISEKGNYLPIAIRLKQEGHEVSLYIKDPAKRNIGTNFVDVISSFKSVNPDITLFDIPQSYAISRRLGGELFGVGEFIDYLCHNKKYFSDICELTGIVYDTSLEPDNSVEGWFNGERFVLPTFYHTYTKKLLADDAGDIVQEGFMHVQSKAKPEIDSRLEKLKDTLKKVEYRGLIRMEFCGDTLCYITTRLNVPTFFELLDMPLSELIDKTIKGELKYIKTMREKAVAVRISVPPFPYCPQFFWGHGYYQMNGKPLYEYNEKQMKHLWPQNIYRGDNGTVLSSGNSGDLGYVTSLAGVFSSKRHQYRVKRTIKNLGISNLQYRIDVC